ncbi:MAG: type II secretion system protein [Phycisphaerales bacterium JB038]
MATSRRERFALRAFTLIELLVVIAVIALLIGILLPALGIAKKNGESAQCQAHMRQYVTAHHTYVADYDVMPGLGVEDQGLHNGWVTEVGLFDSDAAPVEPAMEGLMSGFAVKYVGDPQVFSCPGDPLVRHSPTGGESETDGRFGHMLAPDEDAAAAGATYTRVWFNPSSPWKPADYIERPGRVYVTKDGQTESHVLRFLLMDRLTTPALSADVVEEDEDSRLDNSVFVLEDAARGGYPPQPGESNLLANRHPADSGNVAYHDGHVDNISAVTKTYWCEPVFQERVRMLWQNF